MSTSPPFRYTTYISNLRSILFLLLFPLFFLLLLQPSPPPFPLLQILLVYFSDYRLSSVCYSLSFFCSFIYSQSVFLFLVRFSFFHKYSYSSFYNLFFIPPCPSSPFVFFFLQQLVTILFISSAFLRYFFYSLPFFESCFQTLPFKRLIRLITLSFLSSSFLPSFSSFSSTYFVSSSSYFSSVSSSLIF